MVYAYVAPALLSIAVLSVFPIVYTVYIAFTNLNLYHFDQYRFVGLQNFRELIAGPGRTFFLPVVGWTVAFAALTTLLNWIVGLFLALLLNNGRLREVRLLRSVLIIPWALPAAIAILAWLGLLNSDVGIINQALRALGLGGVPWLNDPFWARLSILLVNLWLGYPFMMSLTLGGLQAIPAELYEAAEIDGASWWQRVRHVTLPGIMSFSMPLLISTFAYNFTNFGVVYLLTQGGPPRPETALAGYTDTLTTFAYKMTLQFNRYDLASAMSILSFLLVAAISFVQIRLTHSFEEVD